MNAAGVAIGEEPLPRALDDSTLLWRTDVAPGRSSPVMAAGRIFITGMRDEIQPVVMCVDAGTGELLWEQPAPRKEEPGLAFGGGYAQCTCTCTEDFVVSFFGASGLLCHDRDGQLVWHKEFPPFNTQFGVGSSPIIVDDRIILGQDFDTDSFLMAIDLATGETIWRTTRPDFIANYATPMLWESDGQRQIVFPGSLFVVGYDFETGEEVWSVGGMSWSVISTPVVGADGTLFVNATAPGEDEGAIPLPRFAEAIQSSDHDKSGTLNRDEFEEFGPRAGFFPTLDRNKDGEIVESEYTYVDKLWANSRDGLLAISPGGKGDITHTHVRWAYRRSLPNTPSPVVHDGHLYMVKNGGIVNCIEAATGKAIKQGRVSGRGDYYSSPVVGDGVIYLANEDGDVSVITADPNWQEVGHSQLDDDIYSTPAIVNGRIYLRTTESLFCFGYREPGQVSRTPTSSPLVMSSQLRWVAAIAGLALLVVAGVWARRKLIESG